jgi:hypothetical protein
MIDLQSLASVRDARAGMISKITCNRPCNSPSPWEGRGEGELNPCGHPSALNSASASVPRLFKPIEGCPRLFNGIMPFTNNGRGSTLRRSMHGVEVYGRAALPRSRPIRILQLFVYYIIPLFKAKIEKIFLAASKPRRKRACRAEAFLACRSLGEGSSEGGLRPFVLDAY